MPNATPRYTTCCYRRVTRPSFRLGTLMVTVAVALVVPDHSVATRGFAQAKAKATPQVPAPAELDKLLAPIALYPDALLGQMLLCAGSPGKVGTLREWMAGHPTLKGTELQDAVKAAGFEPSFVVIVVFPEIVDRMADDLAWTAKIGQAFATNRSAVFESIQRLRARARDAGKLKTTSHQEVETRTTSSGQQVITIEPSSPQVVYVPQYNAQTVYTTSSTTVVVDDDDTEAAVAAGMIGFTAGIALGAAFDNDYYYGPYGWYGGGYMYNDAWDDYYDHREDAREDWMDHREDIADERGDRSENAREQRTDRQQNRQENRPEAQAQREQRRTDRASTTSQTRTDRASTAQTRSNSGLSQESRGFSRERSQSATRDRSGTRSDAFSGYSGGRSQRAASQRGQRSRGSSRGGRR